MPQLVTCRVRIQPLGSLVPAVFICGGRNDANLALKTINGVHKILPTPGIKTSRKNE